MTRALDNWISSSAQRLDALPRKSFALFFAYLAERLMPLYIAFEKKHQWGNSAGLQRQLDAIWGALTGLSTVFTQDALQRLEAAIPSGERFDSPDSTYAQDLVVCVDAALRALIPSEALDGNWLEFALEPIKTKVSIERTGYTAIEGEAADEWEQQLMETPEVAEFLLDCENLISRIQSAGAMHIASGVREEARSKRLQSDEFIQI